MSFLLDLHGAEKFVRVLADSAGLHVVYEDKIVAPRTDGRYIYVPTPRQEWSENEFVKWLFFIYHELGHNVPEMRDCFSFAKKKKISTNSFFGFIMNILEDYRQEYFKYDEYEGKRKAMSKGNGLLIREQLDKWVPSTDERLNMLRALRAFVTRNGENWMPDLIGLSDRMHGLADPKQKEWIDALATRDYDAKLNNLKTAEDVYVLTKRILEEVFKLDPEKEEEEARKMAEDRGDSDGDSEGSESASKKEGKGKGDKKTTKGKDSKIKYDDVLIHKHDEKNPSYTSVEIDYTGSTKAYEEYIPYTIDDFKVKDYTALTSASTSRYDDIEVHSTSFSNKIKRLLTIMSRDKYEYGKKRGYIHNNNLYRVTIKDSKSYAEKIFKQRKQSEVLDTCVSVLIDMSGSMGGTKMQHAAQAAILLNDAIAKLGVPVEIAGFTEHYTGPVHYLFKKFDTKCDGTLLKERIKKGTEDMAQNADGESILYAYHRIKYRKEKKKILIVLSDGQPAADRGYGIVGFTKKIVKSIEKQGQVQIYGIGIRSDAVKSFYKEYKILKESSELEQVLLSFIKDKLLR